MTELPPRALEALEKMRKALRDKDAWMDKETNNGESDPKSGWAEFDEQMADWNALIVELVDEFMAELVEEGQLG